MNTQHFLSAMRHQEASRRRWKQYVKTRTARIESSRTAAVTAAVSTRHTPHASSLRAKTPRLILSSVWSIFPQDSSNKSYSSSNSSSIDTHTPHASPLHAEGPRLIFFSSVWLIFPQRLNSQQWSPATSHPTPSTSDKTMITSGAGQVAAW